MNCKVTYITPRLAFVETFLLAKSAQDFFEIVTSKSNTLFASLHVYDNLTEVWTSPGLSQMITV